MSVLPPDSSPVHPGALLAGQNLSLETSVALLAQKIDILVTELERDRELEKENRHDTRREQRALGERVGVLEAAVARHEDRLEVGGETLEKMSAQMELLKEAKWKLAGILTAVGVFSGAVSAVIEYALSHHN